MKHADLHVAPVLADEPPNRGEGDEVIPFYAAAKKAGIKPIIGIEACVAPRGMTDKEGKADADCHHMILLAKDDVGD